MTVFAVPCLLFPVSKPLLVSGNKPFASILASAMVSCSLSAAGAAWRWGVDRGHGTLRTRHRWRVVVLGR